MTSFDGIFRDLFGTPEMRAVVDDHALIRSWLEAEAALARAAAGAGLIPEAAAAEITRRARSVSLDLEEIRLGIAESEHPLVPVIRAFAQTCDGDAGDYVHWGATTQDIMDTGLVVQARNALTVIGDRLDTLARSVGTHVERERATLMPGRTHGQHALPITFGLKAASWLDELLRHRERLGQLRPRLLVGQLAGAAGTLASLGDDAGEVQRRFHAELGLGTPLVGWHVARDSLAELANLLAMLSATCARVAGEVILLQKNEVAEAEERHDEGNVGSSTMPQKRNPMTAEGVVAASRLARRTAATALEGMIGQHERDMGAWQAEWAWVPDLFLVTDAALAQCVDVVSGLRVHRRRMRANVDLTDGLIMAEAIMMHLASRVGRHRAHDLLHAAAGRSVDGRRPFASVLHGDPDLSTHLDPTVLDRLLDPSTYLGATDTMIDGVLERLRRDLNDDQGEDGA